MLSFKKAFKTRTLMALLCLLASLNATQRSAADPQVNTICNTITELNKNGLNELPKGCDPDINERSFLTPDTMKQAENTADTCLLHERLVTARTESTASKKPRASTFEIAEWLRFTIEKSPNFAWKKGLVSYFQTLGLISYTDNENIVNRNNGLEEHFQSIAESRPCLTQKAAEFYDEINRVQTEFIKKSQPPNGRIPISTLKSSAGTGPTDQFKPGWVFDLAKKFTQGDANAALIIIGMCGHDDTNRSVTYFDSAAKQIETRDQAISILHQKHLQLSQQLEATNDADKVFILNSEIKYADRQLACLKKYPGLWHKVNCPFNPSLFYLPKSLDAKADISEATRTQIQNFVGKKEPDFDPSAKYYHVYAGAYMGCVLAKAGISPSASSWIERQAARGYRAVYLCSEIQNARKMAEVFDQLRQEFPKKSETTFVEDLIRRLKSTEDDNMCKATMTRKSPDSDLLQNYCDFRQQMLPGKLSVSKASDQIREKILTAMAAADGSRLYVRWYIGDKTAGFQLPCTDKRWSGPNLDLKTVLNNGFSDHSNPCGASYTAERCRGALRFLLEWETNAQWTMEQHQKGARFGAEACSSQRVSHNDNDAKFCQMSSNP